MRQIFQDPQKEVYYSWSCKQDIHFYSSYRKVNGRGLFASLVMAPENNAMESDGYKTFLHLNFQGGEAGMWMARKSLLKTQRAADLFRKTRCQQGSVSLFCPYHLGLVYRPKAPSASARGQKKLVSRCDGIFSLRQRMHWQLWGFSQNSQLVEEAIKKGWKETGSRHEQWVWVVGRGRLRKVEQAFTQTHLLYWFFTSAIPPFIQRAPRSQGGFPFSVWFSQQTGRWG